MQKLKEGILKNTKQKHFENRNKNLGLGLGQMTWPYN
jgi:hypothetical protein